MRKILLLVTSIASISCFATTNVVSDSKKLTPQSFTIGAASTGCDYFASDTYNGTELVGQGNWGLPSMVTGNGGQVVTLSWTKGTASELTKAVPCTGTYQLYFSFAIQSSTSGSDNKIYPCVQTTDNVVLYGTCPPSATSTKYFIFTPYCNNGYYCANMVFPLFAKVHLTKGQIVMPPSLYSTQPFALAGGEFTVFYVGP